MTDEEFYGSALETLKSAEKYLLEIAATDISMQTIRDMLENGFYEEKDTESSHF